jgi:hypothetical protein
VAGCDRAGVENAEGNGEGAMKGSTNPADLYAWQAMDAARWKQEQDELTERIALERFAEHERDDDGNGTVDRAGSPDA